MRELTVRIRFTEHSLGNRKLNDNTGRFAFSRSPSGNIIFLASWHHANMRLAAQLIGKHQDEVGKIHWDINVDGQLRDDKWHRVYYRAPSSGKRRYSLHEAFFPDQVIGINCIVPERISEQDLWRLMSKAGQYKGLSPWKPGEFGFYEVESVRPRELILDDDEAEEEDESKADIRTA